MKLFLDSLIISMIMFTIFNIVLSIIYIYSVVFGINKERSKYENSI